MELTATHSEQKKPGRIRNCLMRVLVIFHLQFTREDREAFSPPLTTSKAPGKACQDPHKCCTLQKASVQEGETIEQSYIGVKELERE